MTHIKAINICIAEKNKLKLFASFTAKPAPLRNCTLRPYLTSTYAITMNSTNQTASTTHSSSNSGSQQQLNGPKESNYINAEYIKDRNAFVSTASKKPNKNATINMVKFNKKSFSTNGDHKSIDDGVHTFGSTKTRRNTKSYNPEYHKKSHSPRTKDLDSIVSDDIDVDYDTIEDDEHVNDENGRISTVKSNLSYMTLRMDHQRNVNQQYSHSDTKRNQKSWSRGSAGHKTNGNTDTANDMTFQNAFAGHAMATDVMRTDRRDRDIETIPDLLSSSSRLFSTSTIKSMISGNSEVGGHARDGRIQTGDGYGRKNKNRNHSDSHKNYNNLEMTSGMDLNKPNVAYLKSLTASSSSAPSEPKPIQNAINNHHVSSNNVIVDTYESPPTTMELECVAGYDGGLPQHFILEAYDSRTKKLRLNITSAFSDIPLFRIDLAGMSTIAFVASFCWSLFI